MSKSSCVASDFKVWWERAFNPGQAANISEVVDAVERWQTWAKVPVKSRTLRCNFNVVLVESSGICC